jgi:two-component system chemotaxis sensor kinase CheA
MQKTMLGGNEQFKQSFREEAREILVDLESALLELNTAGSDPELVGRVFRGLHTIKGSGSMFGFEELASFTHNLETAFDRVRNGELAVTPPLVDLTLGALDQMKAMLEEEPEAAHSPVAAQVLEQLRGLIGLSSGAEGKPAGKPAANPAEKPAEAPSVAAASSAEPSALREWKVVFTPGAELMLNGTNPALLVRELAGLGEAQVQASLAQVPPLAEINPERCYVSWEVRLRTPLEREAIRDVFIFVEDVCDLQIDAETPAAAEVSCAADLVARGLEDQRAASGGRRNHDRPDNASSLRVPAAKLDQFVDLVGELVTVQARLSELSGKRDDPEISAVSEEIERLSGALRENSMNIRMMPIRSTFEKFRRLVHDLARTLDKDVELTIEGAETELDKTVIDQLGDPLMHLIRNSMDHGIEPVSERATVGKSSVAQIHLSARYSGASVLIGVSDDGRGINAGAVRQKAIERGLISPEAQLSESETYQLIFQPGFSTAAQVTDLSGRGVGMDVVRQKVESLRGSIDVLSRPGEGTSVTLRLPLTLAIIDGLLVSVGDALYVLPLSSILECIELTENDVLLANGKRVVNVRGSIVPYIRLREYFRVAGQRPAIEQIMVVESEDSRYGFAVDQVLGDCQTVIKNLGRFYRHVQVVSGATILGDGTVALILDPQRLVQEALRTAAQHQRTRPLAALRESARAAPVA